MNNKNTMCKAENITATNIDNILVKSKVLKLIPTLDWYEGEECFEACVTIIIGSGHGVYIPQILCEMGKIDECKKPELEWYWDVFEQVENNLNNEINDWISFKEDEDGFKYNFWFGYTDNGDYALLVNKD